MASRTPVSHTSSKRAIATPILTFAWADWAGIPPKAMAITAIVGRKTFASFISFIFVLLGNCSASRSGREGIYSYNKKKGTSREVSFQYFLETRWGDEGYATFTGAWSRWSQFRRPSRGSDPWKELQEFRSCRSCRME